jgi:hypothetical protein
MTPFRALLEQQGDITHRNWEASASSRDLGGYRQLAEGSYCFQNVRWHEYAWNKGPLRIKKKQL